MLRGKKQGGQIERYRNGNLSEGDQEQVIWARDVLRNIRSYKGEVRRCGSSAR